MKRIEKFYKWYHYKPKTFAIVWLFLPVVAMALEKILAVESLFLPTMGFVILLGLFFQWGDRRWWKDVEHLF